MTDQDRAPNAGPDPEDAAAAGAGSADGATPGGIRDTESPTPGGAVVGEPGVVRDPQSSDPGDQADLAAPADADEERP